MVTRLILACALLMLAVIRAPAQDARLMILHDHGNPVVSEMVRLRIRGEYDLTVSLEDMQFPDSPDYDWMQIARDDWHKERVNGRLLQIFERQVAVFPRRDGAISIGPLTHHLTYVTPGEGRAEIAVTAPVATLNAKPFPGGSRPLAASQLTLTDELSAEPGRLTKDEVLTRRVTIEALGALAHSLPPRPDLRQPWMISFTAPEQRETVLTDKGPVARVIWEWQLRPHTGEPAILPGTGFPWFDTDSRQMQIAPLHPIPFGFAGFGSNFNAGAESGAQRDTTAAILIALAFLGGLAMLLRRQGMLPLNRLFLGWRRLRPSPYLAVMRRAAKTNDLPTLRAAAEAHLLWRGQPVAGLGDLDRQLYAADPPSGFDPVRWLDGFLRAARRRTQPASTAARQTAP